MSTTFDCNDSSQLLGAVREARRAISRGELVVLPTDTVYGVAADAFDPAAVQLLLDAKGRGREMPPPVLVASRAGLEALVESIPEPIEKLIEAYWPGALTIILPAQPSLQWDLGDTQGTVAVRQPNLQLALDILEETGPLAVSSANATGEPAATNIADAERMLGENIAVYLDGGDSRGSEPSTIIDATSLVRAAEGEEPRIRILRQGALGRGQIRKVVGNLLEPARK